MLMLMMLTVRLRTTEVLTSEVLFLLNFRAACKLINYREVRVIRPA